MHRYYYRKLQWDNNLEIFVIQQRSHKKQITSQFEGYLGAFKARKYQQNIWFIKDKQTGQSPTANNNELHNK